MIMTTFCERCRALRSIEDWRETRDEMLSIVLGPCGHVVRRTARLEWHLPRRAPLRLVRRTPNHERVAVS
jgi:Zn ribbon nucleic-acid-binding protein